VQPILHHPLVRIPGKVPAAASEAAQGTLALAESAPAADKALMASGAVAASSTADRAFQESRVDRLLVRAWGLALVEACQDMAL